MQTADLLTIALNIQKDDHYSSFDRGNHSKVSKICFEKNIEPFPKSKFSQKAINFQSARGPSYLFSSTSTFVYFCAAFLANVRESYNNFINIAFINTLFIIVFYTATFSWATVPCLGILGPPVRNSTISQLTQSF